MFPWNYGFHWTPGTIIFLGAFYTVLMVIMTTLANVVFRSWRDLRLQHADAIRWHADFGELPRRDRSCRHELSGEVKDRKCTHEFDCGTCEFHAKLAAAAPLLAIAPAEPDIFGLPFPNDRLYHRGHTWAKPAADGTVTVGLDELGKRLLGHPDKVEMPPVGIRVHANGTAWRVEKRGAELRMLSPVDGEVVATGGPEDDWYLKVRPVGGTMDVRHLLGGAEVRPWVMRELERMQLALGAGGASLADGGVPVADLSEAYPAGDWDAVCGEMFLQP